MPGEVVPLRSRLSSVDTDPHPGGETVLSAMFGKPALDGHRRLHAVSGIVERNEKPVTGVANLMASVLGQLRAQRPVVPANQILPCLIAEKADVTAERVLLGQMVQEGLLLVVSLWACTWAWTRSRADKHNKTAPPDRATVAGSGISRSPITHRVQRPSSSATLNAISPTPRLG